MAEDSVARLVGRMLDPAASSEETRGLLLEAFEETTVTRLHPSWIRPIERLLDSDNDDQLEQTLAALAAFEVKPVEALSAAAEGGADPE